MIERVRANARPRQSRPSTPRPGIKIDQALADKALLGAALGNDLDSWSTWLAVLRAAFALPLSQDDRKLFAQVAGDRPPPREPVQELWCAIGRRGGKSRVAAAIGVHAACLVPHRLAAGEVGEVAIVAATQAQSKIIFKYCLGFLEASPILRQQIESTTQNEIRLRGNIVIAVRAGNYRTVRGRTLLLAVIDEVAFLRDELSAAPDVELFRALVPALSTTGGMLVGISTVYRRAGLLFQKHRDHFGVDDAHVLVVTGPSILFNPTLDEGVIARAMEADPEAARAEWQSEYRSDLSAFLDDATIDSAVEHGRPLELPPRPDLRYSGFVDSSGGRHDAYCVAISHKEGEHHILDLVRGRYPPFDPQQVTAEFAALVKDYRITQVVGDAYAAAWVERAWADCGVRYRRSEIPKSQIYLEALPLFTRNLVSLPDHPRLLRELRLLERRTSRLGKDVVDHPRNASDDHSNSACGALHSLVRRRGAYVTDLSWVSDDNTSYADWAGRQLVAYAQSGGRIFRR